MRKGFRLTRWTGRQMEMVLWKTLSGGSEGTLSIRQ